MIELEDITAPVAVQVVIRDDGKVLWVNTENGCVLRVCQITKLTIEDNRTLFVKRKQAKSE